MVDAVARPMRERLHRRELRPTSYALVVTPMIADIIAVQHLNGARAGISPGTIPCTATPTMSAVSCLS